MAWLTIILATFVSEDLTCITVALLVHQGDLSIVTGVAACYVGIVAGDFGLWLIGHLLSATVLRSNRLQKKLPIRRVHELGESLVRQSWKAVLGARIIPGMRLPVYVAAGALGMRAGRFLFWAVIAAFVWIPLLMGFVIAFGDIAAAPLRKFFGGGWVTTAASALLLFCVVRLIIRASTRVGRVRLVASVSSIWRWEFWPPWIFYLPVIPWVTYLAIRYRGLDTITAANPAIPQGGIVGESKFDILRKILKEWVVPTARIEAHDGDARVSMLRDLMADRRWDFPIVLKPDTGERGAGMKLAREFSEAERYLRTTTYAVLVQSYHPGPFEAGVFYYRLPGEPNGRIFSITDKQFPIIVGDGKSTIENLIWQHSRYRMQADRFLQRLNGQAQHVLAHGTPFPLVIAGNHCQGTMFRDGAHLITPELESRIDEISRSIDGFYFGRFDIRYTDVNSFRAGRDLAIVELNGASSESTNLYDPAHSLISAYRILYRQWRILFDIGARNRARGHAVTPLPQLVRIMYAYYRHRNLNRLSD